MLKKGVFKGLSCAGPRGIHGRLDLGNFFSPQECDNDLGLCFPVHANLSPGGYFFMNNSDFFGPGGGGGGGGGGGRASFRQGLLTGACGFQRRFVRNTTRESYF